MEHWRSVQATRLAILWIRPFSLKRALKIFWKIQLSQKLTFFLQQGQTFPSQAWIQAQASAIAGDGGVAQAGAHGPLDCFVKTFPPVLRVCFCGSWRSSSCHSDGDSQGEKAFF